MAENKKHPTTALAQAAPPVKAQHTEEFTSLYANNIRYEATVYDLKLVFGETDLASGSEVIQQHTAVTIPWGLVKVMLFWLQLNFDVTEATVGRVSIPPTQIPPEPQPTPPELANDPNAQKAKEIYAKLRELFIAGLGA
jgi:hypothetical protein